MSKVSNIEIQDFPLWEKKEQQMRPIYSFELELTARCNLNCRHCYINLPADDQKAKAQELNIKQIESIADQALELGAVWVLLTGGEPLLRPDFEDIYLMLKRKGLLVSVFTNATSIRSNHILLFNKYPPRDIEITIYGASENVYEAVTRIPGSYRAFLRGMKQLNDNGISIRLKAMALQSNLHEIEDIAKFGRQFTKDYFRFDPVLHLRYDRNEQRNNEIRSERLTPEQVVSLEHRDKARIESLTSHCDDYFNKASEDRSDNHLFLCGAGNGSFVVGYDGTLRLCQSLLAPGTTLNLKEIALRDAWENFVPKIRDIRTNDQDYLNNCGKCPILNLCMNCPAHAYLETGSMETVVPYFCHVAQARAAALEKAIKDKG